MFCVPHFEYCVRHFEYCVCALWNLWNASSKFMRVFEFLLLVLEYSLRVFECLV